MSDQPTLPLVAAGPLPSVVMPAYAPGIHTETERDELTNQVRVHLGVQFSREVIVTADALLAHRDPAEPVRVACERAVRQMQDEAVSALGLQHWRTEVEREVREQERAKMRERLRALRTDVRNAPTMDRAALIVQDALEELD